MGVDPTLPAEAAAQQAVELLFAMNQQLDMPHFASLPKVNPEDFALLAEKSKANISDSSNVREMTTESYLMLLQEAYEH